MTELEIARKKAPKQLAQLLQLRHKDLEPWVVGHIPKHYKRLTVNEEKALEYAKMGFAEIGAEFGIKLFYSQALLAGAILSQDFSEYTIVCPSQYGKSFLMGRLALLLAYRGYPVYVVGGSADGTKIIMDNVLQAIDDASPALKKDLLVPKDKLEKLRSSLSKSRLSFSKGGFVETMSLGDTFSNLKRNKGIGRSGIMFVDEAALISSDALGELGRREFSNIEGKIYPEISISNPHATGDFYDALTDEFPPSTRFIMWMDILTCMEEDVEGGRFNELKVLNSKFARNKSQMRRYLLCELDTNGEGIYETPKIIDKIPENPYRQYFLGVDPAYKGKDNICVCLICVDDLGNFYVEGIDKVEKKYWVDGRTNKDIIKTISRVCKKYNVQLVCCDTGWGAWLIQGLAERGIPIQGIPFGGGVTKMRKDAHDSIVEMSANMRAELHLDLQKYIEDGKIYFLKECYEQISDTLPHVTAELNASGRYIIRPKSEIKARIGRSPDEFDSVLLALHAAILYNGLL